VRESEYICQLEGIIKQMLKPLRDVPFSLVIEAISSFKIIPFDEKSKRDLELLKSLTAVAEASAKHFFTKGIVARRPNEVGNYIEPIVKRYLNERGLIAETPVSKFGGRKSVGDPPTDLSLFPHSPGYRLILNNILFPAARREDLKT